MILLVPVGKLEGFSISELLLPLKEIFQEEIEEGEEMPLPQGSFFPERNQYEASIILDFLPILRKGRTLGIVDVDLFVPSLNFVFGLADPNKRRGIISLWRLRAGVPEHTFKERALKEAVHELGHTYGLDHCPSPSCVMHFSNSLRDTDLKSYDFCSLCREELFLRKNALISR